MGLLGTGTSTGTAAAVEAARREVTKAEEAVALVAKQLANREEEIRSTSEAIAATSPAAEGALVRSVRSRDVARGRLEGLQVRAARDGEALKVARATLASAERDAKRAELARLVSEVGKIENGLTVEALVFERRIEEQSERAAELWAGAEALMSDLGERVEVHPSWLHWRSRVPPLNVAHIVVWDHHITEQARARAEGTR